jgi:hypothetical protein
VRRRQRRGTTVGLPQTADLHRDRQGRGAVGRRGVARIQTLGGQLDKWVAKLPNFKLKSTNFTDFVLIF